MVDDDDDTKSARREKCCFSCRVMWSGYLGLQKDKMLSMVVVVVILAHSSFFNVKCTCVNALNMCVCVRVCVCV